MIFLRLSGAPEKAPPSCQSRQRYRHTTYIDRFSRVSFQKLLIENSFIENIRPSGQLQNGPVQATYGKRTDQSGEPCISESTHVYRGGCKKWNLNIQRFEIRLNRESFLIANRRSRQRLTRLCFSVLSEILG